MPKITQLGRSRETRSKPALCESTAFALPAHPPTPLLLPVSGFSLSDWQPFNPNPSPSFLKRITYWLTNLSNYCPICCFPYHVGLDPLQYSSSHQTFFSLNFSHLASVPSKFTDVDYCLEKFKVFLHPSFPAFIRVLCVSNNSFILFFFKHLY